MSRHRVTSALADFDTIEAEHRKRLSALLPACRITP